MAKFSMLVRPNNVKLGVTAAGTKLAITKQCYSISGDDIQLFT